MISQLTRSVTFRFVDRGDDHPRYAQDVESLAARGQHRPMLKVVAAVLPMFAAGYRSSSQQEYSGGQAALAASLQLCRRRSG